MKLANSIIIVTNFFLRGLAFMLAWNWFPHELFNLPEISLVGALGLLMLTLFFQRVPKFEESPPKKKNEDFALRVSLAYTVAWSLVIGISFLIHLFI